MKVNIWMVDDSELREINIFRNKEFGDSIISTKLELEELLNFNSNEIIYFSGQYIQGGLISTKISEYEIIDDTEEVLPLLNKFIKENADIYDINIPDVASFIFENREELFKILK